MKGIVRNAATIATILALASGTGGCGGSGTAPGGDRPDAADGEIVVGVSLLNLSNEFIVLLEEAMREEAERLGVRLIVNDGNRSAERQVQQIENFLLQGVDAIILNPCEHEASSPAIDKAVADGKLPAEKADTAKERAAAAIARFVNEGRAGRGQHGPASSQ